MLSVVVQPSVSLKLSPGGPENLRNGKIMAPNIARGTEPARMTNGSRNELNCAARTKKMRTNASPMAGRNMPPPCRSLRASPGPCRDVNVWQLLGREPARAFDLRYDLVAATVDVETIDEVATQHRREIRTDPLHAQAHRRDLLAIENDLHLGLIDSHIADGRKGKLSALESLLRH